MLRRGTRQPNRVLAEHENRRETLRATGLVYRNTSPDSEMRYSFVTASYPAE